MVSISVIIVNFNARYFLKNCINSIQGSDIEERIEIIVVDNNSSDGSQGMLQNDFPGITCLYNKENVGFSRANNLGVAMSKGSFVLILNPDTMLGETTLSRVLNFSRQHDDFGAAGVRFIDGSGKFLPESKRNFPGLKVAGAKLLGFSKYYYANHLAEHEIAETEILTGAFMFVKRSVYDEVGGFDEDFFMYGEDIDLSYRITQAGYKNFYIGTVKVLHFKGESTDKDTFYLQNFYGALSIFYKKHFPHAKFFYRMIDLLIASMIKLKSVSPKQGPSHPLKFDRWAYVGEDGKMYNQLKSKFPGTRSSSTQTFSEGVDGAELIFFDSSGIARETIIDGMGHPDLVKSKKRIIAEDRNFYLGSDLSNERGEVVLL